MENIKTNKMKTLRFFFEIIAELQKRKWEYRIYLENIKQKHKMEYLQRECELISQLNKDVELN